MYTSFWPDAIGIDREFEDAAALGSAAGYDAIQVDFDYLDEHGPDAYRDVLDEHDLRTGSLSLPVPLHGDDASYERGVERLRDLAADVAAVGADRASTYVLPFSDDYPYEAQFERIRERVAEPARILAAHDIRLGLEYVGPVTLREGHAYEFIHSADGMLELCDAVESDNLGLLLDSWHWYTAGEGAETIAALDADQVVDVHLNDAPAGRARDEQVDDDRRLPGETGVIDVETFLGELDGIGYDGPVMAEPFSDAVAALDDQTAAERTARALDSVLESAGVER